MPPCGGVNHAAEIAKLLTERGVRARAVSGNVKLAERNRILDAYEKGDVDVLCACDLLNEGWDSPSTEVLFMARPTMSKTIYMQQLGRGTRKSEKKKELLVFDFVDNANLFNMPYSLHRLLDIANYRPLDYVLAPSSLKQLDHDLTRKGEKPAAYLDIPIGIDDYEAVDLFNWQNEAKEMKSQLEFIRMVDVQSETIERYVREGKIVPDMAVPIGEKRSFNYYREETIKMYADRYQWDLITASNIKEKFMEFVEKMDMSYSYKPVLLKAVFAHADGEGRVLIPEIVNYFEDFYEERRMQGLVVEKPSSIYAKEEYTEKDIERNILSNPFKRFADMRFLKRSKNVAQIEINRTSSKSLPRRILGGS